MLISKRIDGRKHADEPVALIGDFNSVESNPGMIYLTGRRAMLAGSEQIWPNGLLDAYQTLHAGEKNRRTLAYPRRIDLSERPAIWFAQIADG